MGQDGSCTGAAHLEHTGFHGRIWGYTRWQIKHFSLVFAIMYRHPRRTGEIVRDMCADCGAELRESNGEDDHVHLLVNFLPATAISRLVNSLTLRDRRRRRRPERRCRPRRGDFNALAPELLIARPGQVSTGAGIADRQGVPAPGGYDHSSAPAGHQAPDQRGTSYLVRP